MRCHAAVAEGMQISGLLLRDGQLDQPVLTRKGGLGVEGGVVGCSFCCISARAARPAAQFIEAAR